MLKETMLKFFDPTTPGLEIGAFDLPFFEPREGNCEFADFRSTEELLQMATGGHNKEFVAPVTYNLSRGYACITKRFNWIIASNVFEHLANPIGWLEDIHRILADEGVLFLIIPDKRYIFDCHRQLTQFSEIVSWYNEKLTKPSFAQVFDCHYNQQNTLTGDVLADAVWKGECIPGPNKDYRAALSLAERSRTEYIDCHTGVYTAPSFYMLFNDLKSAGLVDFNFVDLRPAPGGCAYFSVVLRRA